MKLKLLLLFAVLFTLQTNAQTLNPTASITASGTADTFKGGYTFAYASSGTPWNGPLISFGGFSNNYDCQLNSNYGGNNISFRTRNGDIGTWNSWNDLATLGVNTFNGNQTVNGNIATNSIMYSNTFGGFSGGDVKLTTQTGGEASILFETRVLERMRITAAGNVGIGTTTPAAKLDIVGDIYIDNLDWSTDNALRIREGSSNSYGAFFKYGLNDLLTIGTRNSGSDLIAFQVARGSSNVSFNGNVGIGSTNPDQKLTVKGKIHAEEIIVDLNVPADYVFQKYYTGKSDLKSDYTMPTLAEIESFTKKNHHLPNVPSAKEIQQNGLLLGTMSNVLLQKVEELTLYFIELNKELKIQKTQLQLQNDKIILLENKIESNELCQLKN